MGNEDLWGSGVSDSDYNNDSGSLEEKLRFQESDYVDGLAIKFLIILVRGYRGKWAAWKCGRQVALQPPSSKSDQRSRESRLGLLVALHVTEAGTKGLSESVSVVVYSNVVSSRGCPRPASIMHGGHSASGLISCTSLF